jgi:alpha-tubulin suppressor-like RCC1 family protein
MRDKLQEITRLNCSLFNKEQLELIYRMTKKKGKISAGLHHSLVCDSKDQVLSFGQNLNGSLGIGEAGYDRCLCSPILVEKIRPEPDHRFVIMISAGSGHSLLLDSQGRLSSCGINGNGQLGFGDNQGRLTPSLIENTMGEIVAVSAGWSHSLTLNTQGQVFSCGYNEVGQLGLGDILVKTVFTLITISHDSPVFIRTISAGDNSSLLLSSDGQVFAFGHNLYGQLGLSEAGSILTPTIIPNLSDIIDISTGGEHSLFLDSQGRIWGCGRGSHGRLGLGDDKDHNIPTLIDFGTVDFIIAISAGKFHSLALSIQGRVYSFGNNSYGQLGISDKINRLHPTLIEDSEIGKIVGISAGGGHSFLLNARGQIFSFGLNGQGQLGLGDQVDRALPTLIKGLIV